MDVVYKSEALAKPKMDLCTFHAHHPSTEEVDTGGFQDLELEGSPYSEGVSMSWEPLSCFLPIWLTQIKFYWVLSQHNSDLLDADTLANAQNCVKCTINFINIFISIKILIRAL